MDWICFSARMTKIEWPKKAIGYVGYNADFEPGLNSKMMLFNELIDEEAEVSVLDNFDLQKINFKI
jgi:hypothetical protein